MKTSNLKVKTDTLTPFQHMADAKKIEEGSNCFYQIFIKFPEVGIFHSKSEFLHAAILESDPEVTRFVPQSHKFLIGNRPYIPDCYYVKNGKKYIVELKPKGKFSQRIQIPLKAYLKRENIEFLVISNEEVLDREIFAVNWLEIIRALVINSHIETQNQEYKILDSLSITPEQQLGDIISQHDRFNKKAHEIAFYRLCHKGMVIMNLEERPFSYDTEVKLCG